MFRHWGRTGLICPLPLVPNSNVLGFRDFKATNPNLVSRQKQGQLWPRRRTQCGDGLQACPRKVHLITGAVAFVGGRRARAQAGQGHFLLDLC